MFTAALGDRFGLKAAWTTPDAMHDHVDGAGHWEMMENKADGPNLSTLTAG